MKLFGLCVFVLVSGCVAAEVVPASVDLPTDPMTTSIPFEIVGVRDDEGRAHWSDGTRGGPIEVGENATLLLMEAQWSCETPSCRLDLVLLRNGGSTDRSAEGDREGIHSAERPQAGTWHAQVFPDGIVRAKGEIRATVFYGPVPPGFTAFS